MISLHLPPTLFTSTSPSRIHRSSHIIRRTVTDCYHSKWIPDLSIHIFEQEFLPFCLSWLWKE